MKNQGRAAEKMLDKHDHQNLAANKSNSVTVSCLKKEIEKTMEMYLQK